MKNDLTVATWEGHLERRSVMTVKRAPGDSLHTGEYVVVPENQDDFFMGHFSSVADAKQWCAENGLELSATF